MEKSLAYYGKDILEYTGVKGFTFNAIRTIGLIGVYLGGYLVGEKIWKVLYPLKLIYEGGRLP